MSRKSRRKSLGAVLTCLLALVLTGGAVLAGFVFSDPGADAPPPQPVAEERAGEMLRSLLGGEPLTLTQGELSSLLIEAEREHPVSWLLGEELRVKTGEDQTLTLYAPVEWQGRRVALTAVLSLSCDEEEKRIQGRVTSLQAGRLPLPVSWVLPRLAEALPEPFRLEGDVLSVPSQISTLSFLEEYDLAALEVTGVQLSQEGAALSFQINMDGAAGLWQEGLDRLEDFFTP